jgi:hypothetical protein
MRFIVAALRDGGEKTMERFQATWDGFTAVDEWELGVVERGSLGLNGNPILLHSTTPTR